MELARKNQELDAIVRTAPDIIFSRQADGSRDYISDWFYEYTGAAMGSGKGFGWLDFVHPEDRERSMAQWMHCVQSGDNYESEYRIRGRDGAVPLVPGSCRSDPRFRRKDREVVRNLLRHP